MTTIRSTSLVLSAAVVLVLALGSSAQASTTVDPSVHCPEGIYANWPVVDGISWVTCDHTTPQAVSCPIGFTLVVSGEMYRCAEDRSQPRQYRSVCDPLLWDEDMSPVVARRPRSCGYWGRDGNGPLAEVVRIKRIRWQSWGETATGRGWTAPGRRGERPIRISIRLSQPYVCVHNGRAIFLYARERIRTRYGTASFAMRQAADGYCENV
jgi:hypothetical protein